MEVEYNDILNNPDIIDIRLKSEYEKEHLNKSINVPRLILLSNPSKYLNKDKKYYLLCNKGEVSLSCSKILNALGYKCYSVIGGYKNMSKKLN